MAEVLRKFQVEALWHDQGHVAIWTRFVIQDGFHQAGAAMPVGDACIVYTVYSDTVKLALVHGSKGGEKASNFAEEM